MKPTHPPKTPHDPKCRNCLKTLGTRGTRSLPAVERPDIVKRGGFYYHERCLA